MTVSGEATSPVKKTVLIVDDDDEIRSLIRFALRRASFEVVEASTGEAALAILATRLPDVLVLDMGMPGMSGVDVIQRLRLGADTATLPILLMTGSGDQDTVLHALAAGADDFLAKPVRLDELVARIEAHIRTHLAWSHLVEAELHARADVVGAIGRLTLSSDPQDAATALVDELGRGAGYAFACILHLASPGHLEVLATYRPGGRAGHGTRSALKGGRYLESRAREAPWVETVGPSGSPDWMPASWASGLAFIAAAAIFAGPLVVGVLVIGEGPAGDPAPVHQARLLAQVIDYANIVSAAAGAALARHGHANEERARLQRTLDTSAFHPVFQPIMDLRDSHPIGFEALTRFTDGTPPDVQFGQAADHGLGLDFEVATIGAAIAESERLPAGAFVSLNASPALVLERTRLSRLLATTERAIVLELTEHTPIEDYDVLRGALRALGARVRVAVDDAGAGYASLRHIVELRPAFVKLDLSIVRGIEADPLRQGLVAGLVYFAARTGPELIAEGIESDEEDAALRALDIRFGQGYLLGRPARAA